MSAQPPAAPADQRPKTTVLTFRDKRQRGEPLTVLTAYDYPTARAVEEAGADAILVGDSLAMVVLGHPNTLSVTLDEMLHHARAVSRGARSPLLIGDLPFMSYQASVPDAVRSAGRFLQEGGMDAVKLEGGRAFAGTAAAIVRSGIPVQGHIGLTPQSVHAMGGFKVQGRTAEAARGLLEDALSLEDAGCFSLVLEGMPERVAELITRRVRIPTIGIGAGRGTSGQVLVIHDILGLSEHSPRFVRRYAELRPVLVQAATAFRHDVASGAFPAPEHTYAMPDDEWQAFLESIGEALPEASPLEA
jgi:3-methyl-2-oxobutanoate hydroxymethyltransferase